MPLYLEHDTTCPSFGHRITFRGKNEMKSSAKVTVIQREGEIDSGSMPAYFYPHVGRSGLNAA